MPQKKICSAPKKMPALNVCLSHKNNQACTNKTTDRGNMKVHTRSHTGEKPFEFNWAGCQKKFSIKGNMKDHLLRHDNTRPYACKTPWFKKKFYRGYMLKNHEVRMHRTVSWEQWAQIIK